MEFQEYPRWLYTPKRAFVVRDEAEHALHPGASLVPLVSEPEPEAFAAVVAGLIPAETIAPETAPAEVVLSARDQLLIDAEKAGIKVDKRWTNKRIAQEIEKA